MDTAPLIALRDVGKTYRSGAIAVRALDGVNLDIRKGDFIAITGASGSGKSTLLHIVGCLDQVTDGDYVFAGKNIAASSDDRLSLVRNRRMGFVFQKYNLLNDLTVVENVALPLAYAGIKRRKRQKLARKIATSVGLADRLHHRPGELSGGQAQRVAIARALVNDPEIIMADEPTGALDSKTGREILGILHDLNRAGRTIIMVTHDRDLAATCSRRVTMSDGRIEHDSDPRALTPVKTERPPTERDRKGLRSWDLLRIGIKEGIMAHKTRTALTMLGVLIGVSSVIAMSSLNEGSKQKQADQIRALGANLIRIVDRRLENDDLSEARIMGSEGLSLRQARALTTTIPEIRRWAALRRLEAEVRAGSRRLSARLLGIQGDYLTVNNLTIAQGRAFQPHDHLSSRRTAIIGAGTARDIDEPLGAIVTIGGQPYTIIGILQDKQIDAGDLEASGANDPNSDILLPLRTLQTRHRHLVLRNELDEIQLQLSNEDTLVEAGIAIRRFLDLAHHGVNDYDIIIPMDLLKTKQESQKLLDILSIAIAAISLIVGGIGIMNIMLASVTERLREIGIRRAVGATRRDIRLQFLSEAVVISVAGGILGALLAVALVFSLCDMLALPIVFSPEIVALSFIAAVATGLIFGYYPASTAARQNLVEILQND